MARQHFQSSFKVWKWRSTKAPRKKQISAGRGILTSNNSRGTEASVCSFSSCPLLSLPAAEVPELQDTPGTFPGAKARAVPAPSGQSWDPAIVARHWAHPSAQNLLWISPALCWEREKRSSNAMQWEVFLDKQLMLLLPRVGGNQLSSSWGQQNAGRHQLSTQVQMHLVSCSPLCFSFSDYTFLSHSVFF